MNDTRENRTFENYTCAFCACACDDLNLTIVNDFVTAAENACPLAAAKLAEPCHVEPGAWIEGREAALADAIDFASNLLNQARRPLIYGGALATIETQRAAVALAAHVNAVIDSPCFEPATLFPDIGSVTCSLGEAKNRADLIVLWSCDPSTTHPRLLSRYLLDPPGRFRPNGRKDRTLIAVGNSPTPAADIKIDLPPISDFAALWTLRALIRGEPVADESWIADLYQLAARMRESRFGVLVVNDSLGRRAIEAAHAVATALQSSTRFYVIVLPTPGNGVGWKQVVTWLTGRPGPVSFSNGQPHHDAQGDFDVALYFGHDQYEPLQCLSASTRPIPQIALSPQARSVSSSAAVAIATAAFPFSHNGTVCRLDGVSLPLRAIIQSSAPTDFEVLNRLAAPVDAATT
jgi:formylmethanofuran dehydrogenase subunit B